jgi:hypothetical protein
MKKCDNCDKIFRTNWHLQRHLRRKYKCVKVPQNDSIKTQNDSLKTQNVSIKTQNDSIKARNDSVKTQNDSLRCKYCQETYSRKDVLQRHQETCKEKNDVVRILEQKLDIKVELKKDNVCRFCHKEFCSKSNTTRHLNTCKKKQEYRKELERKDKENRKKTLKNRRTSHKTINNNINNTINNVDNSVNNTININCIGKENMKYVTTKMLKQLWKSAKSNEEGVAKTIKAIHAHKDHPENHNIIYTNTRSNVALVKINEDFEYKNINEILKDVSTNTLDAIIFSSEYDDLSRFIKEKYESVCEDDEMNKQASIIAKTELYNSYKNGYITKPSS